MTDLDAELPAIAAGDPIAFGRWLARAEPSVRGTLRALARVADTEAALQEGLLAAWQAAPALVADGRPNGLLRFAVRASRNAALGQARRRRELPEDPAELPESIDPAEPPDPLLRRAILGCLEKLPAQPAAALRARLAADGRADGALAEALRMKLNTFLQNFTRARKLLQSCLQAAGVEVTP